MTAVTIADITDRFPSTRALKALMSLAYLRATRGLRPIESAARETTFGATRCPLGRPLKTTFALCKLTK